MTSKNMRPKEVGNMCMCGGWEVEVRMIAEWTLDFPLCISYLRAIIQYPYTLLAGRKGLAAELRIRQFSFRGSHPVWKVLVCLYLIIICRKGAIVYQEVIKLFAFTLKIIYFTSSKSKFEFCANFFGTCRRPAILPLDLFLSVREVRLHWIWKIYFAKCKLLKLWIF